MKTVMCWKFKINAIGYGDSREEAWQEAVDTLCEAFPKCFDRTKPPEFERFPDGDLLTDEDEDQLNQLVAMSLKGMDGASLQEWAATGLHDYYKRYPFKLEQDYQDFVREGDEENQR